MESKIKEIKLALEDAGYEPEEWDDVSIQFLTSEMNSVEFFWDEEYEEYGETHLLQWEIIDIEAFSLCFGQIAHLFKPFGQSETFDWYGTVRGQMIDGELKKTNSPAFGGESNTNGVPEKGSIAITKADILSAKIGQIG